MISVKSWMVVGIVSLVLGGCSGTGTGGSGETGGGGTGGTGGGVSTGGNGSGGTAGAGGSGTACGGKSGLTCAATEYCDFPDDICGAADGQGVCRVRPQVCPEIYSPTCACDGMVYGNNCEAAGAGVDVSNISACMPPELDQFNCGHMFCDSVTQYCSKTNADVPGTQDSFVCLPLPAACAGGQPSCACIGDPCGAPIAGMCAASGKGFLVTCPGG